MVQWTLNEEYKYVGFDGDEQVTCQECGYDRFCKSVDGFCCDFCGFLDLFIQTDNCKEMI